MILTVGQLLTLEPPLLKLLKAPMGARAAFRVGHTAKLLAPHLGAANEARMKLYRQYGEDAGGGNIKVPDERMEAFQGQMEILWGEKVRVDVKPLELKLLEAVDTLTGEEFLALGPLIVE
jgi:hypothetical protein